MHRGHCKNVTKSIPGVIGRVIGKAGNSRTGVGGVQLDLFLGCGATKEGLW